MGAEYKSKLWSSPRDMQHPSRGSSVDRGEDSRKKESIRKPRGRAL